MKLLPRRLGALLAQQGGQLGLSILLVLWGHRLSAREPLPPRAQEMLLASLRSADAAWDARVAPLPPSAPLGAELVLGVRGSSWYALGLLQRDQPGDLARSLRLFRAVLAQQYDQPTMPWDGTYRRSTGEATPPLAAQMWRDYDPNWRQFIGTVFALALIEYEERIPAADRIAMEQSIRRAVEGELKHGRLRPGYTNIALMQGFLLSYAGERLHRPEWVQAGEAWVEAIYTAFRPHESFDEYNSPTYYGVDLYGLALLRRHGVTPRLRELGATMEAALWRDLAQFYHAGLKNMAGPYDRAYGVDLRRYASLVGVWLGLTLPVELTPLPPVDQPMDHGGDFLCTPTYTILGVAMPADARRHFEHFQGERQLTRPIADGQRVATAWLGASVMIGAEATGLTRDIPKTTSQFHPATIHWQMPSGDVGWIVLRQAAKLDARAEKNQLTITATGDAMFRIAAPTAVLEQVTRDRWSLPGLAVTITTDAQSWAVVRRQNYIEVTYGAATHFILKTQP